MNINANTFVNIDADLAALQTTIDEKLQQEGDSIENAMQDPGFLSFMQNIFANAVKDNVFFKNHPEIKSFLLYSPENYFLRNNAEEEYIKPLGTRGQGLLNCLKELYKNQEKFEQIQEALSLFDWFESIDIGTDRIFGEGEITIKDRFLHDEAPIFDQRSANEGFLYLLFYAALFVSDDTPAFFAIDNIDNGMNPRMCAKLIEVLSDLAEKNGKQVIFTTHNPAILDGLDLSDENQRLFVISRNRKGRTKAKRIFKNNTPEGKIPTKLSELFLRGSIGGLPENF